MNKPINQEAIIQTIAELSSQIKELQQEFRKGIKELKEDVESLKEDIRDLKENVRRGGERGGEDLKETNERAEMIDAKLDIVNQRLLTTQADVLLLKKANSGRSK